MSITVLGIVKDSFKAMGLNYDFKRWKGKPKYPYFVGEYQEVEPMHEDGMQETAFILTGFSRWIDGNDADLQLEEAKEKIAAYFPSVGGRLVTAENGSAVAIFYSGSFENLPTGDTELEKIQINLTVKEWRKNT